MANGKPLGGWLLAGVVLLAAAHGPADDKPKTLPGEKFTPAAKGERHADKLKTGDPAPDFTLADPTGKTEVTLSAFKGKKPVVLVFGSCT
jgi:hypothetical protein